MYLLVLANIEHVIMGDAWDFLERFSIRATRYILDNFMLLLGYSSLAIFKLQAEDFDLCLVHCLELSSIKMLIWEEEMEFVTRDSP